MSPEAFERGMNRLAAMWPDRSPSKETVAVYFEAVGHLHDTTWMASIGRCLRECKFFPVPAEILEKADELLTYAGVLPETPAEAWRKISGAAAAFQPGMSRSSGLPDHLRGLVDLYALRTAESEYEVAQIKRTFMDEYTAKRKRQVYGRSEAMSMPLPEPMTAIGERAA